MQCVDDVCALVRSLLDPPRYGVLGLSVSLVLGLASVMSSISHASLVVGEMLVDADVLLRGLLVVSGFLCMWTWEMCIR